MNICLRLINGYFLKLLLAIFPLIGFSQARMVLNDNVFVVISNSGKVVLDNANPNALATAGTGGNIISEGQTNQLIWNISNSTGLYTIPWTTLPVIQGGNGVRIPLQMNLTSPGNVGGNFEFSTYETATDANTAYPTYPSAITNMNGGSPLVDQSLMVVDRFWILNNSSYGTKPDASISFTYDDNANEIFGTNTITESNLQAQRWNISSLSWEGLLFGATNDVLNVTSGVNVSAVDFWPVWVLVDQTIPLPVNLIEQHIDVNDCANQISWTVNNELNVDYYSVYRSYDGENWANIAMIDGSGTSSEVLNYNYRDENFAQNGILYYQIKQVDIDGQFTTFNIMAVNSFCNSNEAPIFYPNPTNGTLNVKATKSGSFKLHDVSGRLVFQTTFEIGTSTINLPEFALGSYMVELLVGDKIYFQKLIIE